VPDGLTMINLKAKQRDCCDIYFYNMIVHLFVIIKKYKLKLIKI